MSDKVTPIKDMWSLIASIVDTQPAFNILPVATSNGSTHPKEVRDFARFKLREAITQMRAAADALEERLDETEKAKR